MLIDEYLPEHQFSLEAYAIDIDAPMERVYPIVRKLDLRNAWLLKVIFWLRSIPGRLVGRSPLGPTLEDLERAGLVLLEAAPPREVVLGLVGKIWTPAGGLEKVGSAAFRGFCVPGFVKVVWNFSLEPLQNGHTRLTTQTRAQCTDSDSRKKLRRYALFMRSLSGTTRKSALRAIKRQAESTVPRHE